ncbi:MAG: hypothetical protein ACYS29_11590 [Planctomycetota bacterium]
MTKRISCRVVKSVVLGETHRAYRRSRRSGDDKGRVRDFVSSDVHSQGAGRLHTYTIRSGRAKVSSDTTVAGRILDCYA